MTFPESTAGDAAFKAASTETSTDIRPTLYVNSSANSRERCFFVARLWNLVAVAGLNPFPANAQEEI